MSNTLLFLFPQMHLKVDLLLQMSFLDKAYLNDQPLYPANSAVIKHSGKLKSPQGQVSQHPSSSSLSQGPGIAGAPDQRRREVSHPERVARVLGHRQRVQPVHTVTPRAQVPGGSSELKVPEEPIDSPADLRRGPTCVSPPCGRQTCAPRTSRKRNDSSGRTNSTAGRRGSRAGLGLRGVQGPGLARRGRNAGSCPSHGPFPGPGSHTAAGGAARSAPRRRRRRGSQAWAPRRRHAPRPAASASPPRRPGSSRRRRLPQREGGEGATAPLGSGRRGESVPRPFRSSQAPARGATRAEQTGSTTRGGRPLCDVISPRRPSCGPAGFPRSPRPPPASFRPPRGRLRAAPPPRRARPASLQRRRRRRPCPRGRVSEPERRPPPDDTGSEGSARRALVR